MRLLGAQDRVLRSLRDAELHHALGFDLDLFAGLRIAAHASGAVLQDELADARQREGVLRVLVSEGRDLIKDFNGLLLGKAVLLSDEGSNLSFGECFGRSFFS